LWLSLPPPYAHTHTRIYSFHPNSFPLLFLTTRPLS
jgi:hypothetical protein